MHLYRGIDRALPDLYALAKEININIFPCYKNSSRAWRASAQRQGFRQSYQSRRPRQITMLYMRTARRKKQRRSLVDQRSEKLDGLRNGSTDTITSSSGGEPNHDKTISVKVQAVIVPLRFATYNCLSGSTNIQMRSLIIYPIPIEMTSFWSGLLGREDFERIH
jgi:hypothetical protein